MDGLAVFGALAQGFLARRGRDFGLADGRGALRRGSGGIVVLEQHRGEVALHVPDDVVGQHAQKDMGADAMGPAIVDPADVEVARFEVAEAAFSVAEAVVGEDDGGGGEAAPGKTASDHIEAVERGFRGDRLAGIIVRGDLRHVALVEQRELQGAALGRQGLYRRDAQRGDPVDAGGAEIGVDVRLGDHAAVADQHDALQPKAQAQLADLIGERARIAEVAFEHLDGDRAALRRAQKTEDDLRPVGAMIAAVAELRQFAPSPLQIAQGDIVEYEHAVREVALGEDLLDASLAAAQKVEGGLELVLVDLARPSTAPSEWAAVASLS